MEPIRKLKGIQVLAAIDGEISTIESYLTLSHEFLFKENKFIATYIEKRKKEGYVGEIMIER